MKNKKSSVWLLVLLSFVFSLGSLIDSKGQDNPNQQKKYEVVQDVTSLLQVVENDQFVLDERNYSEDSHSTLQLHYEVNESNPEIIKLKVEYIPDLPQKVRYTNNNVNWMFDRDYVRQKKLSNLIHDYKYLSPRYRDNYLVKQQKLQ